MLKVIVTVISLIIVAVFILFAFKAFKSRTGEPAGIVDSRLTKCSSKPNCVCSEYSDKPHYIEPLALPANVKDSDAVIAVLVEVIEGAGGVVQILIKENRYIAAEFNSRILGFVDDFEVRIDMEERLVHFRSASREGYSDFGVNKARVRSITSQLEKEITKIKE
ncbi:DUF1499 domain-containing protein [Neptuniibacter sp. QD48_11]|uniref:DUF1499 domain-containing protein n=1 Tax=unclassified Neptuniibacter TaxID=2630693 RepID=UPI0039F5FC25